MSSRDDARANARTPSSDSLLRRNARRRVTPCGRIRGSFSSTSIVADVVVFEIERAAN